MKLTYLATPFNASILDTNKQDTNLASAADDKTGEKVEVISQLRKCA